MKTSSVFLLLSTIVKCFADEVCEDTNGTFKINRESIANPGQELVKRCGWLSQNMDRINRYCYREDVKDTCPFTCCECGNCVLPSPSPTAPPPTCVDGIPPSKGGKGKGGTPCPTSTPSVSSFPSALPSDVPTEVPSVIPTATPTSLPSYSPSATPTSVPSVSVGPSAMPSLSVSPSSLPSTSPSAAPSTSKMPSSSPTLSPTSSPSESPSVSLAPSPCQDSNGTFKINRESIANPGQELVKRCGWLSQNMDRINRYCYRDDVKDVCPFTCCECDNCELPSPSPSKMPSPSGKGKGFRA